MGKIKKIYVIENQRPEPKKLKKVDPPVSHIPYCIYMMICVIMLK
jgi:hypothetical protein